MVAMTRRRIGERSLAAEPLAAGVALVGDPQLQRRNLRE
jgi:hypothetical protein